MYADATVQQDPNKVRTQVHTYVHAYSHTPRLCLEIIVVVKYMSSQAHANALIKNARSLNTRSQRHHVVCVAVVDAIAAVTVRIIHEA